MSARPRTSSITATQGNSVGRPVHRVSQHRSSLAGVEALTLVSTRSFPRHAHDTFGIGVIASGAQRSWSGVGTVEARAGDVITVNPGEMHDGLPLGDEARGWRMLYLDPAIVARLLGEEGAEDIEIARPAVRDPVVAERFARLFARAIVPRTDALAAEGELLGCLAAVFLRHGSRPIARNKSSPPVAAARRRLDEAPERPTSLADLARLAGVSRFQLLRGFFRETGATPHAYLVQRRVRLARRLLAEGDGIAEAALNAGFADQSHLTRAFRRQFGVTPGRYRAAIS